MQNMQMTGRPKRAHNQKLATDLMELASVAGLNKSDVAKRLGVAPSTLGRSLKINSFSERLTRTIELALKNPDTFSPNWSPLLNERELPKRIGKNELQILQKLVNLLPSAELILKSLVQNSIRRK